MYIVGIACRITDIPQPQHVHISMSCFYTTFAHLCTPVGAPLNTRMLYVDIITLLLFSLLSKQGREICILIHLAH